MQMLNSTSDKFFHDLVTASVNSLYPSILICSANGMLGHISHASMKLNGVPRNLQEHYLYKKLFNRSTTGCPYLVLQVRTPVFRHAGRLRVQLALRMQFYTVIDEASGN
jgi:hypothetical protein